MLVNTIKDKYLINNDAAGLVQLQKRGKDGKYDELADFTYNYNESIIKDIYVTVFKKLDESNGSMSGKYVQFTDINGVTSETVIPDEMFESNDNVELDIDYLYMKLFDFEKKKDYEQGREIYIKLQQ